MKQKNILLIILKESNGDWISKRKILSKINISNEIFEEYINICLVSGYLKDNNKEEIIINKKWYLLQTIDDTKINDNYLYLKSKYFTSKIDIDISSKVFKSLNMEKITTCLDIICIELYLYVFSDDLISSRFEVTKRKTIWEKTVIKEKHDSKHILFEFDRKKINN